LLIPSTVDFKLGHGVESVPKLNLKPTHKAISAYYDGLRQFEELGVSHETAIRSAFQSLLQVSARQFKWTLVPE
jgi:hypothetical protein